MSGPDRYKNSTALCWAVTERGRGGMCVHEWASVPVWGFCSGEVVPELGFERGLRVRQVEKEAWVV